jgi:hypothetical protein
MTAISPDRRLALERRRTVLRALWHGNFARRRISPRRHTERFVVVTDWFHPQWLAVAVGILLLCCADAFLTLTLIMHGATELNPLMAPLVQGSGHAFVFWKLGLTTLSVVLLTVLARLRAFGGAAGVILYMVLAAYVMLIAYELFLLRNIPLD